MRVPGSREFMRCFAQKNHVVHRTHHHWHLDRGDRGVNFRKPEKEPHHKVKHDYGILDPQPKREMGTLLGPAILPGSQVLALQNGDEIFPAMLEAVAGAKCSITFETYI